MPAEAPVTRASFRASITGGNYPVSGGPNQPGAVGSVGTPGFDGLPACNRGAVRTQDLRVCALGATERLAAELDDQILMGAGMDTDLLAEANAWSGLGVVRHPRSARRMVHGPHPAHRRPR